MKEAALKRQPLFFRQLSVASRVSPWICAQGVDSAQSKYSRLFINHLCQINIGKFHIISNGI